MKKIQARVEVTPRCRVTAWTSATTSSARTASARISVRAHAAASPGILGRGAGRVGAR